MDYLNIVIAVLAIGFALVRYIAKAFNEPPSTATTPPIAPNKIPTQKRKSPNPRVIPVQSPPITELGIPDEGTSIMPLPAEQSLQTAHKDDISISSQAALSLTSIRQKEEAKKAFLYAEIFNRKYE